MWQACVEITVLVCLNIFKQRSMNLRIRSNDTLDSVSFLPDGQRHLPERALLRGISNVYKTSINAGV